MAECLILGVGGGASGSDDVTASAAQVLAPYTAITSDSDGEPKEGTIPTKEAAVYSTSTADQTINSGQYLGGNQTIKAVTTENIDAGNIKKGVTVKVGDANNAGRIKNINGTYTTVSNGQTAVTAAALRKGYSGFANGGAEVKGNMTEKGAATYYATTSDQTIAKDQYLTGAQTIKKLTQTNLSSGNVRKGVSIYINNGNANVFSTTGTWYGNKKTIAACAYCGRGLGGDPNPSETQSFTMPDSGTVYYGGMSSGYYGGSGNCRIYKNNSVVDNRDLGTYYVRGTMFNKSFAANKGDVIKVEATATSGDATVTCIQAVIVY